MADRVALVSGGNRGLGLEMALALVEAGARAVYCVDLPEKPSDEWKKVREYAAKLASSTGGEGRLEYVSGDVTNQVSVRWIITVFFLSSLSHIRYPWHCSPGICALVPLPYQTNGICLIPGADVEAWRANRRQGREDGRLHCCGGDLEVPHKLS